MELGTGIAISTAILGATTLFFRVMSKNHYNKDLCNKIHQDLDNRLNVLISNHDRDITELNVKIERIISRIEAKLDAWEQRYVELREIIAKIKPI